MAVFHLIEEDELYCWRMKKQIKIWKFENFSWNSVFIMTFWYLCKCSYSWSENMLIMNTGFIFMKNVLFLGLCKLEQSLRFIITLPRLYYFLFPLTDWFKSELYQYEASIQLQIGFIHSSNNLILTILVFRDRS